MTIKVILGAQWGDEGKGKLTDILAPDAQLCARAAGGHNAGHSIVANGVSYSFHLLPSGLINPNCLNFIGSGVVFHVPSFFSEMAALVEKGLPSVEDRLLVSDRVHIILQQHIAVDGLEEKELGDKKIGIGPTYSKAAAREGVRLVDVFNKELFDSKLRRLEAGYRKRFGDLFEYDLEEEIARFDEYRPKLAKYAVDGVSFMKAAQEDNKNIIVEGANALMLDIKYGSYPFVTSSNTTIGGIIGGLTLNPKNITETIGVVKAYTTRVGQGAFKTEDTGEIGTQLQEIGREWGTSTGRRRRCGWLDLVVVKYSASINYYSALNLTKLDVLDTFETIKIAIAYKVDGEELDHYPADLDLLERAEVVYHEMPGWQKPTTGAKTFYDLPKQAREYIEYIEKYVGVKVKWIGTGPDREAMIMRA
ncbi:Adenylosuccinate synthetase [Fusarium flagelliforme]|uniref:Adenylosuccinate synthetase n=1 Tax=Fusarium flagelliforme TaxID=2675880 RepID=UPI001E8DDF6E|nr:Adenylosuccinate synthetase [Fusarium flagelliforme]KAH7192268.1 Adenylosuccinate synthetase [Fusarium flagelliforme]